MALADVQFIRVHVNTPDDGRHEITAVAQLLTG